MGIWRSRPLESRERPFGKWENVAIIIDLCALKENYSSNLERKCEYATLTHHFTVVCL